MTDRDMLSVIGLAHSRFGHDLADATHDPANDKHVFVGTGELSDIQRAQVNLWRWQRRNFGLPTYTMYACGVLEECAEFGEALNDDNLATRRPAMIDAFGDICIYSCNFATALELDFETLFQSEALNFEGRMRQFCHAALKSEQRIRGYADPEMGRAELGHALASFISQHARRLLIAFADVRPEDAFLATVASVTKRDWKADPTRGGEAS